MLTLYVSRLRPPWAPDALRIDDVRRPEPKDGELLVRVHATSTRSDCGLSLREVIGAGHYRAVVDRTYPLEQVIDAHRYVETREKTGNVVLAVQ